MEKNLLQMVKIVEAGSGGGHGGRIHRRQRRQRKHANTARMYIQLKPLAERKVSVYDVIERLRPKLAQVRGATYFMQANQDVRVGGRKQRRSISSPCAAITFRI